MQISVIIAALNADQWLDEQLDALATQTFEGEMEVLVCDNGSTDRTRDLVRARQASDPRFRLVDAAAERGSGYARNVGVQQASGVVVAFCDADDVVAPDWVAAMLSGVESQDVVSGRTSTMWLNPSWTRTARPVAEGLQQSSFLPFAGGGNLALRRDAFLSVGGFDPRQVFLEDVDFSWRLQLAGHPLGYAPDALIHVRLRRSIEGIYRQGYQYGQGIAELESRYSVDRDPCSGQLQRPSRLRAPVSWVKSILAHPGRGSIGHVLWQLGWHFGNRAVQPRLAESESSQGAAVEFRPSQVATR